MAKSKYKVEKGLEVGSKLTLNKLLKLTKGVRINILSSYIDPDITSSSYLGHYFVADREELKASIKSLHFLHKKKRWVEVVGNNWLYYKSPAIHIKIIGDRSKPKKLKPKPKKRTNKFDNLIMITTKEDKHAKGKNIHSKSKGK